MLFCFYNIITMLSLVQLRDEEKKEAFLNQDYSEEEKEDDDDDEEEDNNEEEEDDDKGNNSNDDNEEESKINEASLKRKLPLEDSSPNKIESTLGSTATKKPSLVLAKKIPGNSASVSSNKISSYFSKK